MSGDFALCRDCHEVTTGRIDASKGFLADASSNHFGHRVTPFDNLAALPMPIRNAILRLGAGVPIRDNDITLLKLGFDMEDEWTSPSTAPAAANVSATTPVPAKASGASTRLRPVSVPTSGTPVAAEVSLLDLLDGVTA